MKRLWFVLLLLVGFVSAAFPQREAKGNRRQRLAQQVKTNGVDTITYRQNVRGTVFDNESLQPLPGASVRLLATGDSVLSAVVTGMDGQFLLPSILSGKYELRVSYVGYKEVRFQLQLLRKQGNFRVQDIMMSAADVLLNEAVVVGQIPEMTVQEDTVVYHVDAFRLPEGSLVEELVERLPGVEKTDDGRYTLNGKEITQVLVDGREFMGGNMKTTLQNLPVDIVEKVKAYDRQSDRARITGIDDGEERMVIDLTIKKNKKKGWFGNFQGGYGTSDRYTGRANVNHFVGEQKVSFVAGANNTRGNGTSEQQNLGFSTNFKKGEALELDGGVNANFGQGHNNRYTSSQSFENPRAAFQNSRNLSGNYNSGMDLNYKIEWRPDTLTSILLRPNFSYDHSSGYSRNERATFREDPYEVEGVRDPLQDLALLRDLYGVNHRVGVSQNGSDNVRGSFSALYNRRFSRPGRNFSINIDVGGGNRDSNSESFTITEYYLLQAVTGEDSVYRRTQYSQTQNRNWNAGARLSYSEPLADRLYLQFTYAYNYRYTDNDRDVSSIFDPHNQQLGVNLDNYVEFRDQAERDVNQCGYTSNIYQNHTAGVQLRINKTQYQLTLGGNLHPQSSTVDYTKGLKHYDIQRTVLNASPSLNFRYRFSRQESLRIIYGGSTGQPGITDLIPDTLSNVDPLNIRLGNPELKPSFTHNIQTEYQRNVPSMQRSYSATVQMRVTQNGVSNRTQYDEQTGGRVTQPQNINGNWNGSANFHFNTAFTKSKRFHADATVGTGMTQSVGYVYQNRTHNTVRNRTRGGRVSQSLRFSYRNDWLDVSMGGNYRYNCSRSTNPSAINLDTWHYGYSGRFMVKLPWNMDISSDLGQSFRRGYSDASMNREELIWNMQVSQHLLRGRKLTIIFQAQDLLRQRDEVSRSVSATARTDTRTEGVHSYFLCSVRYRLGKFGGRGGKKGKEY